MRFLWDLKIFKSDTDLVLLQALSALRLKRLAAFISSLYQGTAGLTFTVDDNIDVQSASSWAPKVATKCESKHWYACGAKGRSVARSVGHVITKSMELLY